MSDYAPTVWVDGGTPVNAANLNKIEQALDEVNARPKIPTPLQEGKWLTVSGGAMVWADAPAAGIQNVTLHTFTALDNEPPAATFATLDTRNSHPVLDFDAAVIEYAIFRGVLDRAYAGAGVIVALSWAATSAVAGNVVWTAAFERLVGQDIDADSFAAALSVITAAPATSGVPAESEVAFTDGAAMDALVTGDPFRFRIARNATDAGDTMAGDAELLSVEIRNA